MNENYVQLNLFEQPIEVVVDPGCTLHRAAALVGCSEEFIYRQLSQKKRYECEAATVKWRVYPASKQNGSMLVKVALVHSPTENQYLQSPREVVVAPGCTLHRAAALVGCSEECIYQQISQNKRFEFQTATIRWRVYSGSKDSIQVVKVALVYSPAEKVWSIA